MKKVILLLFISISSFSQCKLTFEESKIERTNTITYNNFWKMPLWFSATRSNKDTTYLLKFNLLFTEEDKPHKDTLDFKLLSVSDDVNILKCRVVLDYHGIYEWSCPITKQDIAYFKKDIAYFKLAKTEYNVKTGTFKKFIP